MRKASHSNLKKDNFEEQDKKALKLFGEFYTSRFPPFSGRMRRGMSTTTIPRTRRVSPERRREGEKRHLNLNCGKRKGETRTC